MSASVRAGGAGSPTRQLRWGAGWGPNASNKGDQRQSVPNGAKGRDEFRKREETIAAFHRGRHGYRLPDGRARFGAVGEGPSARHATNVRRRAQPDGACAENAGRKAGPVRDLAKVERWYQGFSR